MSLHFTYRLLSLYTSDEQDAYLNVILTQKICHSLPYHPIQPTHIIDILFIFMFIPMSTYPLPYLYLHSYSYSQFSSFILSLYLIYFLSSKPRLYSTQIYIYICVTCTSLSLSNVLSYLEGSQGMSLVRCTSTMGSFSASSSVNGLLISICIKP